MSASWSLDAAFVKAVHTTLKRLHRDHALSDDPLAELVVVEGVRGREGWPDTSLGRAAALRSTLGSALQKLRDQDADAACLLERRFWREHSVSVIAGERSVAHSTLYSHQQRALEALARKLWSMEQAAQKDAEARAGHLARNLPFPTYERLFGRDEEFVRIRSELVRGPGPRLVCLEGLAGLGKTALAHRFATWAARERRFADIAWVTAHRRRFVAWSRALGETDGAPAPEAEALLDRIGNQLGLDHLRREPVSEKAAYLRETFRRAPHLVVVDNLNPAVGLHVLASRLRELVDTACYLFTSCHSLYEHSQVTCITLDELAELDARRLARSQGAERGIDRVTEASDEALYEIYDVVGGHPLAIKLIVAQARALPLERALNGLREARGRSVEHLYRFIYHQAWELLSPAGRRLLLAMRCLPAPGGTWEDLSAVSGLADHVLELSVQELASMSLLSPGGLERDSYAIHQLTHTFISSGMVKRWIDTDQVGTTNPPSSITGDA